MPWETSFDTHIWVFSVGRGNTAFIRTGMNHGLIIDLNGTDFNSAKFIKDKFLPKLTLYKNAKIAQAVLSHPHADHINQCRELEKGNPLWPTLLTCPHNKDFNDGAPSREKLNWNRIKNRDGDQPVVDA